MIGFFYVYTWYWSLGLIYRIDVADNLDLTIDMTLTAPNCPAADFIMEDVQQKLESIPGNFSIHASSMKMSARLLHEEDLINLIDDLRRDARALILVRACALSRLARTVSDTTATPHLQAECQIEWITLQGPASALASGGRQ